MDITSVLEKLLSDSNPTALAQSLIIFWIVWSKVKPHLTRIENEIGEINKNMKAGFQAGEARFQKLETRVEKLETKEI